MATTTKTNAVRFLDSLGIPYELRAYEVDPYDLAAETVAEKIGLPHEQVFKTLLAKGTDPFFAVIPANTELDLKAAARAVGARSIELVPLKDLQNLTGYIRGGVTVFAARKPFPVIADWTIEMFDVISVSAGQRGVQILMSGADYVRASGATSAEIAKPKTSAS